MAIENTGIKELINRLSARIPHENRYLVKSRMINYPYKNYHLFSEMNLSLLFGHKESYEITFSHNENTVKKSCKLTPYQGVPRFIDDSDFISYEFIGDTAVLHLNACICNETYKTVLKQLSEFCTQRRAKTFILDLSKNMGGSSAVIDEFLKYVDVPNYRRYEMINYSSGEPEYISKRENVVINHRSEHCFPADLYCKVSQDTFSSARTFAVTLKDNGVAKIIGTPTGGKPNSFGMPRRFKTPNHKIAFRVSTSRFLRPDQRCDEEIALFPDEKIHPF